MARTPAPAKPDAAPAAAVMHLDDASLLAGLTDLRWRLDELLAGRPPVLVVDISQLSRMSSATLAALLWAQRRCRARGGRVVLRHPNKRCGDILTRTGLAPLFSEERPAGRGGAHWAASGRSQP